MTANSRKPWQHFVEYPRQLMLYISSGRLRLTGKSFFIRTRANAFTYKKLKSQKAASPNLDNCGHLIIAVIPSQSEFYNSRIFSLSPFSTVNCRGWRLQVGREKLLLFYKAQNTHIQIRVNFKFSPRFIYFYRLCTDFQVSPIYYHILSHLVTFSFSS